MRKFEVYFECITTKSEHQKKKKIRLQVKILDFRKIGYLFRRASQFPD